jgi:3-oxoacyl-[acyl-carrier-protein] synthase II
MNGQQRRAVISGVGVVSPFGVGWSAFREGLRQGRSATRRPRSFDCRGIPCQVVAEVPDFNPLTYLSQPDGRRTPRVVPMAVLAAREAFINGGLDPDQLSAEEREGVDVVIGSGGGGIEFAERQYGLYFRGERQGLTPHAISASVVGMLASEICLALQLHGRSHVLSNGCTSSTDALGYALDLIRSGRSRCVLSGGADACITPGLLAGYCLMRAVATRFNEEPERASRPFDRRRDGFVFGEGAWMLVVEEAERAQARGAPLYAEIAGYGATCDAFHRVAIKSDACQPARAVRLALADAGIGPGSVDYLNLHGTATPLNDPLETRAMKMALGTRAYQIPASATKSMIGHPQGASGAAGVAAALLSLQEDYVHPTINLEEPDPECDLDYVPGEGRRHPVEYAACNCLGFGSKNACLVLKRAG